jgi:DNA-binding response OmpR family regulator
MPRPTLLIAEPDPVQALSVRKLVMETAKYNVMTAHSTREAMDIFHLFPNVSAAVLVSSAEIDCDAVAHAVKATTEKIPVIMLAARIGARCADADHHLSSYEPEELLELVRSLLGDPRKLQSERKPDSEPKPDSERKYDSGRQSDPERLRA